MSGFMLVCTCYRQRAETENTLIIAFPQEIALLSALQKHKTSVFHQCVLWDGRAHWKYLMFIKILGSFSVDSLWEGSDQVSKCPSSLLTDSSCFCQCLFVTLTVALRCLTDDVFMSTQVVRKFAGWIIRRSWCHNKRMLWWTQSPVREFGIVFCFCQVKNKLICMWK